MSPPTRSSTGTWRARPRILIVEDETTLARVLARAMGSEHDVTLAGHGAEALRVIDERGDGLDLIVSDVHMPWMNGIDLHRALVARASPLAQRFVLMSGSPLSPAHGSYVADARLTLLPKPFAMAHLEHTLASILVPAAARGRPGGVAG